MIVGYTIGLNLSKLGFQGYRVDLELNSTKKNDEIFNYCLNHKYIYQVNKSIFLGGRFLDDRDYFIDMVKSFFQTF